MGQREVYEFLVKKEGKWLTSKEICAELGISRGCCQRNLRRLLKGKAILLKTGKGNKFWYSADFGKKTD